MIRHNHIANNKLTFSEVIYCNDLLFSEKLAYHTQNIGVFSDVVYQYNKREESLSDVNSLYKIKQRLLEFFKVQKFLITINKEQYARFYGLCYLLLFNTNAYSIVQNRITIIKKDSNYTQYSYKTCIKYENKVAIL